MTEFFAVTSKTGMHIGLWDDEEIAQSVLQEESDHTIAKLVCGKEHDRVKADRDKLSRTCDDLRKQLEASRLREQQQLEAITVLANQGGTSPTELAQLGVGNVIENPNWKQGDDPSDRYSFIALDLNDLADMNNSAMKQQATVAKFRQLKEHFVAHQRAITFLLDELQSNPGANRIGQIRYELADIAGRNI